MRPFYLPRLSSVYEAVAMAPWVYLAGFGRTLAETVLGFAAGALVGVGNGLKRPQRIPGTGRALALGTG